MRLRVAVLASLVAALVAIVGPDAASAAPRHNHGLTINATPNPVIAGDAVLIYGQLNGPGSAGQLIRLYHRLDPDGRFTLIGTTTTDAFGFYEFTREEGVVTTNRSWFVRGPDGAHSRTLHEHVAALVSLAASSSTGDTNHPIMFFGHVFPNHAGERVYLQEQVGQNGDDWTTLDNGRLDADSNYAIAYRWSRPGVHELRAVFRGDERNIGATSGNPIEVTIDQTQVADFTIKAVPHVFDEGDTTTTSGVLDKPGTMTPEASTTVTLWGHGDGQAYHALAVTTTGRDGSYSFPEKPTQNELFQVRTTLAPRRHTAQVFVEVRDVVTLSPSAATVKVGDLLSFTGTVTPNKAEHMIYLQRLGKDGDWHNVDVALIRPNSSYAFAWRFGASGTFAFRARIPGDPENAGGASAPATITVVLPPVASLPPAS